MISVKIRGSIMAVTAAVVAATVFMAPTVSADTKSTPSAAVVTENGDEKDKKDEKKDCVPFLTQLDTRLQSAGDALDSTEPQLDAARTALAQASLALTQLENSKCLCAAEVDLLRDLLNAVIALLNATPVDVPAARETLGRLIVSFDVLQVAATCDNGKCGGRPDA
jgi:hypothetical protein